LEKVRVGDYDALVIGGGAGVAEFTGTTKGASAARRVIAETMSARKPVGAIGLGPAVLAEAGVVRQKRVACAPEAKERLEKAGAEVVAASVATMESLDGQINLLTARDAQGAGELAALLAGVLRPAGKTP
jgi:protease I